MKKVAWLLWKDAVAEARSLERLGTLVLFSAAVLVTLHFSLEPGSDARAEAAAGFLWAAVLFGAVLEMRRSFEAERATGTLDALRASPLDPTLLFVAKALSSTLVISVLGACLVVLTALLFAGGLAGAGPAFGIVVLGVIGLVGWGTLFSAVASGARSAELVLPVLLFPLVVPQTIACVRLLAFHLSGARPEELVAGYVLLGAFDLLSWGTSLLLFEYVLDE